MPRYKLSANDALQWLQWVVVTLLGVAGAWGTTAAVLSVLRSNAAVDEDKLFGVVAAVALGAFTGILQGMRLRTRLSGAGRWTAATLGGYIAVLVLLSFSNNLRLTSPARPWDAVVVMGLLGSALGAPQYWVLRQSLRKAGWWVLASAVGMQGFLMGSAHPAHNARELIGLGVAMGAVYGATTGVVLVWLLRVNGGSTPSTNSQKMAA